MQFLQTSYFESLPVPLSLPTHNSICFVFHLLQTQYVLLPCVSSIVSGESCHCLYMPLFHFFVSSYWHAFCGVGCYLYLHILLRSVPPSDGGLGLMQWRLSVGTFKTILVPKIFCSIWNKPIFYISLRRYMILVLPLRLFFGLLTGFSYSFMLLSLLPLSFLLYPFTQFCDDTPTVCNYFMVTYFARDL